jgi:hypothetical protein
MTISAPLTSRARKQAVVIQCVTRTSGVCRERGVGVRTVVSWAGAESDTRRLYHFQLLRAYWRCKQCR